MNTCLCCFEDYIVKCGTTIQVNAKLTPATQYTWVITDKFERQYSGDVTTDVDGFFSIPVEDLPPGLLTEYSGEFKLQVFTADACAPEQFKVAQVTDCIRFTISAGNREKNNLGCEF